MSQFPEPQGKNDNELRTSDMEETRPYAFGSEELVDATRPLAPPLRDEASFDEICRIVPDNPI